MVKKTFKIGEYCAGGIITVETVETKEGTAVHLIQKQWDHSAGDRRSSDQSKAQELDRHVVVVPKNTFQKWNYLNDMERYLTSITTSYYADEVLKFVKSKVPQLQ